MRWTREQYIDLMTGNKPERQMFTELFGLLIGLDEEWEKQGAAKNELNLTDFCFDYVPNMQIGNTGVINKFKEVILSEDENHYIRKDYLGRTVKLDKKTATIPLPQDYPVNNMDSWLKIKHMFEFDECRINTNQIEQAKIFQKQGGLIRASIPGGFDIPRELMGEEVACLCYYEQPELMWDIIETLTDTSFKVLERISRELVIDNLTVHEDMAGKHAPLIGPNQVTEFVKPLYRKVWDMLSSRGTKLFSQDSDGNMNSVIDAFVDCGVNIFYPAEPAANMDIVELRKKYGKKIAFKGGIDKHILRSTKEEIHKELLYKMQPLMQDGGVIFALDHRIPNGTPLENYRYYVKTAREILDLPTIDKDEKSWQRMAF